MTIEATMLRLKRQQRDILADKLPDAANLALGALVFGQFLSPAFSTTLGLVGLAVWIAFMARQSGSMEVRNEGGPLDHLRWNGPVRSRRFSNRSERASARAQRADPLVISYGPDRLPDPRRRSLTDRFRLFES